MNRQKEQKSQAFDSLLSPCKGVTRAFAHREKASTSTRAVLTSDNQDASPGSVAGCVSLDKYLRLLGTGSSSVIRN